MKLFLWTDILSSIESGNKDSFFNQGTGISVGSFDGLHKGHRVLVKTLVEQSKKNNLLSGIVTFRRPLPSIKHSLDYQGDISTLKQRLDLFEEMGVSFVILVDFDDNFAARSGTEFFKLLVNQCNMKLLAEGVDFRCGYKGATDTQALRYFCDENGITTFFVDPVYYMGGTDKEERISSSYIRTMIKKGFLATVEELLERKFCLDLSDDNQVLPVSGIYHCKNEKNEDVRVEILDDKVDTDRPSEKIYF